ncbi:MAG: 30S ribosomal protein S8 [Candidatus Nealsonbacteria bacterium]|nr:30S ribosomal protein S8 [Candidatus Nealsonbacteria bacterium]
MMTDPITDMLNRIKNGQAAAKEQVAIPYSNFKYEIAKILEKEKFVESVERKGRKINKFFEVTLKYEDKVPAISGIKRVSKPGRRIYLPAKDLRKVRDGYGMAVISTPKGLMSNRQARKEKAGGEVLFEIW